MPGRLTVCIDYARQVLVYLQEVLQGYSQAIKNTCNRRRHYCEAGEDEKKNIQLARCSDGFHAFIENARLVGPHPPEDHSNHLSGQTTVSLHFYTSTSYRQQFIGVKPPLRCWRCGSRLGHGWWPSSALAWLSYTLTSMQCDPHSFAWLSYTLPTTRRDPRSTYYNALSSEAKQVSTS